MSSALKMHLTNCDIELCIVHFFLASNCTRLLWKMMPVSRLEYPENVCRWHKSVLIVYGSVWSALVKYITYIHLFIMELANRIYRTIYIYIYIYQIKYAHGPIHFKVGSWHMPLVPEHMTQSYECVESCELPSLINLADIRHRYFILYSNHV